MRFRSLFVLGFLAAMACSLFQTGLIFAQAKIEKPDAKMAQAAPGHIVHPIPVPPCGPNSLWDWSEKYSDSTSWAPPVHTPNPTNDPSCTSSDTDTGTVSIASGKCTFDGVHDGADVRVYRSIGTMLVGVTSWKAEFEFQPTALSKDNNFLVGHDIFALTAGNSCPLNDTPTHPCALSNQDGVMVEYSETQKQPSTTGFYLRVKQGTNHRCSSNFIRIPEPPANAPYPTYYFTLERFTATDYRLSIFTDAARTSHVNFPLLGHPSPICFSTATPSPIVAANLTVLQHGNIPWGGATRMLSGFLDNTCIKVVNANPCCPDLHITGRDALCCGEQAMYSVPTLPGEDVSYDWHVPSIFPAGSWSGQGTNSITLNTATLNPCPSTITLSLDVTCQCQTWTITKTITLYPVPDPKCYSLTVTENSQHTSAALTVAPCLPVPPGWTSSWYLYSDPSCTGQPSGLPYLWSSSNPPTWSSLQVNKCYVLIHGMTSASSPCPPVSAKSWFSINNGAKLVKKGLESIHLDEKELEKMKAELPGK